MAGSLNRVVLVGRLARDVEVRKTQSGISVASFTVACDRRYSRENQENGNNQQTADFISCVAWRQRADFLGTYGHKGSLVGVEGSIQTRNYTNNAGQKVYVTEVVCDNVTLLGSKNASQSTQDNSYGSSYNGNSGYNSSYGSNSQQNNAPSYDAGGSDGNTGTESFDTGAPLDISSDDLPF